MKTTTVAWFSAGVSSAVAIKQAIAEIDNIIYIHIDDQHGDSLRFVAECGEWFGKPVAILQSAHKTVESVVRKAKYVNGPFGAKCTVTLKKNVRKEWEQDNKHLWPFRYVWGMDADESSRAERIRESMPEYKHLFPLIERGIGKAHAHEILRASGIKRPAMYELGYHNNNCIGCVKGGMGYWNKIRADFPEVFATRAKLEREIGASCINGVFLDELKPDAGLHEPMIIDECGILCGVMKL